MGSNRQKADGIRRKGDNGVASEYFTFGCAASGCGQISTLPPVENRNGVAMSSSPCGKLWNGDEDVATPFHEGAVSRCALRIRPLLNASFPGGLLSLHCMDCPQSVRASALASNPA